jgi:hypothetical protein
MIYTFGFPLMTGDYSPRHTPQDTSRRLKKYLKPGSVGVGHSK